MKTLKNVTISVVCKRFIYSVIFFLTVSMTSLAEPNNDTEAHLRSAEFALNSFDYDQVVESYINAFNSSNDIETLKQAAWLSKNYGFKSKSILLAKIWLKNEPDNDAALLFLINRQLELDLIIAAKKNLKLLISRNEGESDEILYSIYPYLSDENVENLEVLISSFTKIYKKSALVKYLYSSVLLENGKVGEAIRQAELSSKLSPIWEKPKLLLARALLLSGKNEEAVSYLAHMIGDQINPSSDSRLELALAYMSSDRLDDALGQVSQILLERNSEYSALRLMAIINFRLEHYDSASKDFNELLEKDMFRMDSLFYLARISEQKSNFSDALKYYSMVTSGVNTVYSQRKVVSLLLSMNQVSEAKNHLKDFGQKHPKYMNEMLQIESNLYSELDEYEEALVLSEKLVLYYPKNTGYQLKRANLLLELDRKNEALEAYSTIVKNSPRDPNALNAYGYVLTNYSNNYKKAYKLIKKAIKLDPDNPAIIDSYGWILYRMGKYEEAEEELNRAYQLYKDPEIAFHLIKVLLKTNKKERAKNIFTEARVLFMDNKYLIDINEDVFK
ncbi:MAG: tetratricopeptide repeat protein [Woeseiaceae bacterium]